MASHLTFQYDALGDILYVNLVHPYAEQDSDMIGDGVVARMNPETGRVENLEILSFMATLHNGEPIDLAVDPNLTPIWSEIDIESQPAKHNAGRRAAS